MEEAIAAPDMPISSLNISKKLKGILIQTAVRAAPERSLVFVTPTRKARKAKKGNENNNPKLRQFR